MELKDIISSGLLELYVAGIASQNEVILVEQWSKDFPEVKREIDELQKLMEDYSMVHAIAPSPSVKDKIFAKIQSEPAITNRPTNTSQQERHAAKVFIMPTYMKLAAASCIILLLTSLIFNYTLYKKYQVADDNFQASRQELNDQKKAIEVMNTDLDVVTNKYASPVVLSGTAYSPEAVAKIFWMKNSTGDVYIDPSNLPQTPSEKQYQLWAIVDGKPVDAGMITTKKGVYRIQKMKSFGKVDAFAITLEKSGGSPSPTLDRMIVHAKI